MGVAFSWSVCLTDWRMGTVGLLILAFCAVARAIFSSCSFFLFCLWSSDNAA